MRAAAAANHCPRLVDSVKTGPPIDVKKKFHREANLAALVSGTFKSRDC
jgi:hypothetical protein